MKLEEIIAVSACLDSASIEPHKVELLMLNRPDLKKLLHNFATLSEVVASAYQDAIPAELPTSDQFWSSLEERLEREEMQLNSLLSSSLGDLPSDLAERDIWQQIEAKLNQNDPKLTKVTDLATFSITKSASQPLNLSAALSESYKMPSDLVHKDIWGEISNKLDQDFHQELFSESAPIDMADKQKFFLGLSEYLDGECSTPRMQVVNEHLLECSTCRNFYLSLLKVRTALKHTYKVSPQLDQEAFWTSISDYLFPEDKIQTYRQAEGF
ncbi:MAG: zf-HC2 domain-containing protein [Candidatus Caenarcaniphilales bacterium]|nr:zf-HC2 domain-containing protein [Candidatus Caenarcaniphilales bacterium]